MGLLPVTQHIDRHHLSPVLYGRIQSSVVHQSQIATEPVQNDGVFGHGLF